MGNVTYAQLLAQPDVYRGKIVTVQGRVLREESLDAPSNYVGITSYHRLVLRPSGGGVWPIIVYCLKLPDNFSHGDKFPVEVAVDGVFFKNWSYAWDEGLGLAPVILAKNISLHPAPPTVESAKNHGTETTKTPSKSSEKLAGGFRDVLELIDLGPEILERFSKAQH